MLNKENALLELDRLVKQKRPCRGISCEQIGLGFGCSRHQCNNRNWGSMPVEKHRLHGLIAHHEKMSIQRIRWHLEHYEELISGIRPMHLCVDGDRKYIIDGCHRTTALLIVGFEEFKFKVCMEMQEN